MTEDVKDKRSGKGRIPAFSFLGGLFDILRKDPALKEIYGVSAGGRASRRRGRAACYLVGGVLRNLLLKEEAGCDYDLCTDGDVRVFSEGLAKKSGGSFFLLDETSSTWRVVVKKAPLTTIDVSRIREGDIVRDLGKRDFTVNALAVDVRDVFEKQKPALLDPHSGIEDAKKRILRAVSGVSFKEDPLRILRAVRLAQQYNLKIERSTWALLKEGKSLISETAKERVRDELALVFSSPLSFRSMEKLFEAGVMQEVIPELRGWQTMAGYDLLSHSVKTLEEAERMLLEAPLLRKELKEHFDKGLGGVKRKAVFKIASFFHDIGKPLTMQKEEGELRFIGHDVEGEEIVKRVLKRLRFSRKVTRAVSTLVRNHHRIFALASIERPSQRSRAHFFNSVGGDMGLDLLLIGLSDARATRGAEDRALFSVVMDMMDFYFDVYSKAKPRPLMNGREIMIAFGVPEGPAVGEIIKKISEGVEEGILHDKKNAVRYIKDWLSRGKREHG